MAGPHLSLLDVQSSPVSFAQLSKEPIAINQTCPN